MALKINCPRCGEVFDVESGMEGRSVQCPGCRFRTSVPEVSDPTAKEAVLPPSIDLPIAFLEAVISFVITLVVVGILSKTILHLSDLSFAIVAGVSWGIVAVPVRMMSAPFREIIGLCVKPSQKKTQGRSE